MTAEALSPDGVPIDWCQRCECAVIHAPVVCEQCMDQIAINDEDQPKPIYRKCQAINSNFEHLVNTAAPERDGLSDALIQAEYLFERELKHHEQTLATDEKMLWFYLERDSIDGIHSKVNNRVAIRATCRELRRHLASIRALMKEIGL